jgi:hypothetical protein
MFARLTFVESLELESVHSYEQFSPGVKLHDTFAKEVSAYTSPVDKRREEVDEPEHSSLYLSTQVVPMILLDVISHVGSVTL